MLERRVTSHQNRLCEAKMALEKQRHQLQTHLQTASVAQDLLYEVFCPSVSFCELTTTPSHPEGHSDLGNATGTFFDPPRRLEHGG